MVLPIDAILNDLVTSLENNPNLVLIAPPGAGKTTSVAPALLKQSWNQGKIVLLSPRRLAARMAAHYIAQQLGEEVGKTVGFITRTESKKSANNKIVVMTEGVFRNQILHDPLLDGVSAVLFDEIHERSLDSDFGLALALETQQVFRPDLRLVAMSATLNGDRFSALMQEAPVIQSEGKSHPLHIHYVGRHAEQSIEKDLIATIKLVLTHEDIEGDILLFLPGLREIERLADMIPAKENIIIHKLHGAIDPAQQQEAVRPDSKGRRKIILATNIAETSLTIDGVRIVIDSGLVRRARYDRAANVTRLVTEKSSLASATQRAGRAARQDEGHAFRLWEEAANGGLLAFDPPEILECDLSALYLDSLIWGEGDPSRFTWLDPPPKAGLEHACQQLSYLELIDSKNNLTSKGRLVAQLPMPPHLGHMLLWGAENYQADKAAKLVIILQEHGLGGRSIDIEERYKKFASDNGVRAKSSHRLAAGWSRRVQKLLKISAAKYDDVVHHENCSLGAMCAVAFPDRVAKRQDKYGEDWLGVGGRRFYLDPERARSLSSSDWIAITDVQGNASKARIMSAVSIEFDEVETLYSAKIREDIHVTHDSKQDRIDAGYVRSLGAITLAKGDSAKVNQGMIEDALLRSIQTYGLDLLPWSQTSQGLRQRTSFAGEDILDDDKLMTVRDDWLLPLLDGKRRIGQVDSKALHQALELRLGWDVLQRVNTSAPSHFTSPDGSKYAIDYSLEGGPTVELRVQALFGLSQHPVVGLDRVPLVLSLTSPAGRPIQTTKNLPEFWLGSWHDVAKEMRGRYPKHHWPEDPTTAQASLKTKKRQNLK